MGSEALSWLIHAAIFRGLLKLKLWLFAGGLPVGGGLGLFILAFGLIFGFVWARNLRR